MIATRQNPDRPAPDRPAPDRPAPDRPAPDRPAPDRPAPDRLAPDRLAPDRLAALAGVFHLMGDPSRLSILMAVLAGPRPVGGIAAETGLSPSLVSHHLRLLRGGRLVRASRRGKQVFYVVDDAHISSVLTDMTEHVAEPTPGGLLPGERGSL